MSVSDVLRGPRTGGDKGRHYMELRRKGKDDLTP
jgi:hypothetical protein